MLAACYRGRRGGGWFLSLETYRRSSFGLMQNRLSSFFFFLNVEVKDEQKALRLGVDE